MSPVGSGLSLVVKEQKKRILTIVLLVAEGKMARPIIHCEKTALLCLFTRHFFLHGDLEAGKIGRKIEK